uniref:GP-PDE domain-containing protein n=1 Tax=Meloidogyne hapla TaxID=6305 RepID=A0A1I8B5Z6_MELHA
MPELFPALTYCLILCVYYHQWPFTSLSLVWKTILHCFSIFVGLFQPSLKVFVLVVIEVSFFSVLNFFDFYFSIGSPLNAPENTLASFEQAKKEGVDLVEFDIGFTKDFVPVLMHDDDLDRTTNMTGLLNKYNFVELEMCNCAAKFSSLSSPDVICKPEPICTLENLIEWSVKNNVKMLFDVKDTEIKLVKLIVLLFERYDLYNKAIVCSFFPTVVYRIKKENPNILTGGFITYEDIEFTQPRSSSKLIFLISMVLDVLWIWCVKLWIPEFLGVDMVLTERREISPLVFYFLNIWPTFPTQKMYISGMGKIKFQKTGGGKQEK